MHSTAGSPTETSFLSKHAEKSEQQEKVEKAKQASTVRTRSTQTTLSPADLPPSLASQLVTVCSPRDVLSAYTASNDRRLRRLLCRYVNQIQYGCKNLYCTVPSCLTCRQRKSKTPVRKYTDASARALAAHIIDEQGEKGLCHSDPAVPWFESPGSRQRRKSVETRPQLNGHAKGVANGHLIKPANGHLGEHGPKSPSARQATKVDAYYQSPDMLSSQNLAQNSGKLDQDQFLNAGVDTTIAQSERPASTVSRKDPRSFTQAIFHSFGLRSLWARSTHPPASTVDPPQLDEGPEPQQARTTKYSHEIHVPEHDHTKTDSELPVGALSPNEQEASRVKGSEAVEISHGDVFNGHISVGSFANIPQNSELDDGRPIRDTPNLSADDKRPRDRSDSEDPDNDTKEEVDNHTYVQVAPFLSDEFLSFFWYRRDNTLHRESRSLLESRDSSQNDDVVENSVFFCLRDPWRTLQSLRDWHKTGKASAIYDNNGFEQKSVTRGIVLITQVMPMAEVLRTVRIGLTDVFKIPSTWRFAVRDRRQRRSHKVHLEANPRGDTGCSENVAWVSDEDAARLCVFGILLLQYQFVVASRPSTAGVEASPDADVPFAFAFVKVCNGFSRIFQEHHLAHMKEPGSLELPHHPGQPNCKYRNTVGHITDLIDYFDDYDAQRLFSTVVDLVGARCLFAEMRRSRRTPSISRQPSKNTPSVAALVASFLDSDNSQSMRKDTSTNSTVFTIEWARLLFTREWNGNALVPRASSLGGCLQLLMAIFVNSRKYALDAAHFYMPLLADRLDMVEMPVDWLSFRADNKNVHLLSYSFLFEPRVLVSYFRAINYSRMSKAAIDARAVQKDVRDFTDSTRYPVQGSQSLLTSLRPYMANNFVITVRRDNLLEDAINQVWRRQRRELMRPLKVRMGMDEGEQGIDIGGVQQEFFRILFAQFFDPNYGMFTTDERTRSMWFKPGTLEPLFKFEILGVFMSLAIYNSITLPVTFPLALYRKLLGLKVKKVHQIVDGWPELAAGLQQMLDWSDGDVGDVFARTYEFAYEAFGKHVHISMKEFDKHTPWPPVERKKGKEKIKTTSFELPPGLESESGEEWAHTQPFAHTPVSDITPVSTQGINEDQPLDDEAPLVTNANREQYIKDYILWLTHRSIEPQYKAFAKGFFACLDRTALSIFSPEALKTVVEGYVDIDLDELEATTKYEDGYDEFSTTVQDFWHVVRNFNTDQHKSLLEFVTSTDRVPVNGIKSVQFIIQRNGSGDDRLPTSMTCFGRLLLPQYSSRAVLEEKLTKAIENSEGFGVA